MKPSATNNDGITDIAFRFLFSFFLCINDEIKTPSHKGDVKDDAIKNPVINSSL